MKRLLIATVAAMLAAGLVVSSASAIDKVDTKKLRKAVDLDSILEHERAFQDIALANDGTRAATTLGYDESATYVAEQLEDAGYDVTLDEFDFPGWTQNGPATLAEISPTARSFVDGTDFIVSQFSSSTPAAGLTADVVPTNDIQIPPPGGPGTGTSGCEVSDFPANTAGNIALMQRGTCPFVQKYQMAKDAGAVAALIFNDGFEGRTAPLFITSPVNIGIPTIMTSSAVGQALYADAQTGTTTAHIVVDATTTPNTEVNVIADTGGDPDRTIVVGAHLDSVEAGPGINDNGSGSSTILEIAEEMADLNKDPRNRVRFAFWGAEEAGLVGSTAYVQELVDTGEIDEIEANLNFDMVGSPNFARFVYDGDNSTGAGAVGPPGSAEIEQTFLRYFDSQRLVTDPTPFDGRSDYGPFIAAGVDVPAGGLFTGAEGMKTAEQEERYGGVAGLAFDPCYHQACDTFFNLSYTALDQMSDAAAHATWTLARSESPITAPQGGKKHENVMKATKRVKYKGPFRIR